MIQLKEIEASELPDEILDFAPIECMDCGYDGHIPRKFFLVEPEISNESEYNELRALIKNELGYDSFGETACDVGYLITVSRCPKCNSENIFEDF